MTGSDDEAQVSSSESEISRKVAGDKWHTDRNSAEGSEDEEASEQETTRGAKRRRGEPSTLTGKPPNVTNREWATFQKVLREQQVQQGEER
jgi:hypothetical protein